MAEAYSGPDELKQTSDTDEKDPEVEQVASDTEKVFETFVYKRLSSQIDKEATEGDLEVGSIPTNVINILREERELENLHNDGNNDPSQEQMKILGQKLAEYGDEIQAKYRSTFVDMISRLNLSSDQDFAYDSFTRVAIRLFENGISWGRIIALLCFGYEIAIHAMKHSTHGIGRFLKKIVSYIVSFVVNQKIAKWIAEQGGWVKALLDKENPDANIWKQRGAALVVILSAVGLISLYAANKS